MNKCLNRIMLTAASVTLAFALSLTNVDAAPKIPALEKAKAETKLPAGTKLDINSASQADLEKLPGVGPATAKKIVAGRPYSTTADLVKAGIPAKNVEKLSPLVAVGPASAAPKAAAAATAKTAKTAIETKAAKTVKTMQPPPSGKDMVWVNSESKIYHRAGSSWYGKTKQGSYMSETEAIKAGYRAAK